MHTPTPSPLGWDNSEALTLGLPSGIKLQLHIVLHGFIMLHLLAAHHSLTPLLTLCQCFVTSPVIHLHLNSCLRVYVKVTHMNRGSEKADVCSKTNPKTANTNMNGANG